MTKLLQKYYYLLVSLFVFIIYLITLAPSVVQIDSTRLHVETNIPSLMDGMVLMKASASVIPSGSLARHSLNSTGAVSWFMPMFRMWIMSLTDFPGY